MWYIWPYNLQLQMQYDNKISSSNDFKIQTLCDYSPKVTLSET